jgi:hypothetical protein
MSFSTWSETRPSATLLPVLHDVVERNSHSGNSDFLISILEDLSCASFNPRANLAGEIK